MIYFQNENSSQLKTSSPIKLFLNVICVVIGVWTISSLADEQKEVDGHNNQSTSEINGLESNKYNGKYSQLLTEIREHYELPSISIAINIGGKVVWAEAQGMADISNNIQATINTQYAVGSIAKPMTTLAMARLHDKGKLALTAPIETYGVYKSNLTKLTPYQLASHTAGIVHHNKLRQIREFNEVSDHFDTAQSLDVFETEKLLFTAGTDFHYSSNGYILLSDVIGQAAKENYIEVMKEEVFNLLGMPLTEHDTSLAGGNNEAIYYKNQINSNYLPSVVKRDRSFLFGGGGYISTPSDLVNMAWGLQQDTYLSSETKEQLFTPVKLSSGKVNKQNYALGWRVHEIPIEKLIGGTEGYSSDQLTEKQTLLRGIHHGGTVDGAASAYLLFFPESSSSIAFTTNTIPKNESKNRNIRQEMWKILFNYQKGHSSNH